MDWYKAVKKGIYEALCAAFELDPDGAGLKRFVPAYEENTVVPQAPRNVNVTYYTVQNYTGDSTLNYQQETQVLDESLTKTRIQKSVPASVLVTFYGPDADGDAEKFWSMFKWDRGAGSPRSILRQMGIVPIGSPDRPVSVYEVEGTYQRRRSDVKVNLAYYESEDHESSHVDVAPEVIIQTQ